jgi:hypothetical protein
MAATIRLTVLTGPHKGQRYCFRAPTSCLLGRAAECFVRLTGADRDLAVSRRHCQLDIDPPLVRVQDLGSLNGTFVNGHLIGGDGANAQPQRCDECPGPALIDSGDVITVGGTSLKVDVVDCPPPGVTESVWNANEQTKANCTAACQ